MDQLNGIRIDKWLWAARFFKTRSQAAHACELGRIEVNTHTAKASREIHVGDTLRVRNEAGEFTLEILQLSTVRGPAAQAQALYRESEASRELRLKVAAEHKAMLAAGGITENRPNKRDRRDLARFRGRS